MIIAKCKDGSRDMRTCGSNSEKLRKFFRRHGTEFKSVSDIANMFDVSNALVYQIKGESEFHSSSKRSSASKSATKCEQIVEYLTKNPNARTKDVAEMFEAAGPYVSQIRTRMKMGTISSEPKAAEEFVLGELENGTIESGEVTFDVLGAITDFVKRFGAKRVFNCALDSLVSEHKVADLREANLKILDVLCANQIRVVK
jgi:transposase